MRNVGVTFFPIFCVLLLASCGFPARNQTGPRRVEVQKKENGSKFWDAKTSGPEAREVREKVNRLLEKKDCLGALMLMQREVSRGLPQSLLEDELILALNGTLEMADNLLKEGHPGQAGILFQAALTNIRRDATLSHRAGWSDPEVLAKIENCSNLLMENGLLAYRAGDLDKAIEEWRKIQIFQPGHQASLRAIDTTNVQRRNLKRIGLAK